MISHGNEMKGVDWRRHGKAINRVAKETRGRVELGAEPERRFGAQRRIRNAKSGHELELRQTAMNGEGIDKL